jgi:hypothetical protein
MGSHFVWRNTPLGREVVITNLVLETDVLATQHEIDEMYANAAKTERKAQILSELSDIDFKSIRALRANDKEKLDELEAKAVTLRQELSSL